MYCKECGTQIPEYAQTCPNCGAPVTKTTVQTTPTQSYGYEPSYALEPDVPSPGLNILSFLVPIAGLILYLVERDKSPIKAKACGKWALISFILGIVISIIAYIVLFSMFDYYM